MCWCTTHLSPASRAIIGSAGCNVTALPSLRSISLNSAWCVYPRPPPPYPAPAVEVSAKNAHGALSPPGASAPSPAVKFGRAWGQGRYAGSGIGMKNAAEFQGCTGIPTETCREMVVLARRVVILRKAFERSAVAELGLEGIGWMSQGEEILRWLM